MHENMYGGSRGRRSGGALALGVGVLALAGFLASLAVPFLVFDHGLGSVFSLPRIQGATWWDGKFLVVRMSGEGFSLLDFDAFRMNVTMMAQEGDAWRDGISFQHALNMADHGEELWVFFGNTAEVYKGGELSRRMNFKLEPWVRVLMPPERDEVLIFKETEDGVRLTRTDLSLQVVEDRLLGKPKKYYGKSWFDPFWPFWHEGAFGAWDRGGEVYYSRVTDGGFAEPRVIAGRHALNAVNDQCDPPLLLLERESEADPRPSGSDQPLAGPPEKVYEPYVFTGGTFEALPTLAFPHQDKLEASVLCVEGVPNFLYWGDREGRKELREGQWRDAEMVFPSGMSRMSLDFLNELLKWLRLIKILVPASLLVFPLLSLLLAGLVMDAGGDDRLETALGEPVVITPLRPASVAARTLAFTLDLVVVAGLFIVLGLLWMQEGEGVDPVIQAWKGLALAAGFLLAAPIYLILLEAAAGATLGKRLLGLKVVKLEGQGPGFAKSLSRNLFRPLDFLLGAMPAAVSMALSPHRQRLGDRVAGTTVISARGAGSAPGRTL